MTNLDVQKNEQARRISMLRNAVSMKPNNIHLGQALSKAIEKLKYLEWLTMPVDEPEVEYLTAV